MSQEADFLGELRLLNWTKCDEPSHDDKKSFVELYTNLSVYIYYDLGEEEAYKWVRETDQWYKGNPAYDVRKAE